MASALESDEVRALADQVASSVDGRRIATAESCTVGEVARALSEAEGASDWLLGGVVAYHRDVKYDLLDVARGPVVNHSTAQAMARGVVRLLGADVAVGITGAAGPEGLDGAEPGTVFIGYSVDGIEDTVEHHFGGSREDVTTAAVRAALAGLVERLGDDLQPAGAEPDESSRSRSRSTSSSPT